MLQTQRIRVITDNDSFCKQSDFYTERRVTRVRKHLIMILLLMIYSACLAKIFSLDAYSIRAIFSGSIGHHRTVSGLLFAGASTNSTKIVVIYIYSHFAASSFCSE